MHVMDARRRRLCTAVLSAALAVTVAAGCSDDEPSAAPPSPSATTSPEASAPKVTATSGEKPRGNQGDVLASLPGNASGDCVEVGDLRDVRSGTMAAGNFATARQQFADQVGTKSQPTVFLYLIPSDSRRPGAVTVRLQQVPGGPARTIKSEVMETADRWRYFPVNLSIPAEGTWRITATTRKAKGCFLVTFG